MKKLILLAIIIGTIVIPARNARTKDVREGLRKTLIQMVIFDAVYLMLVTLVWWRLA